MGYYGYARNSGIPRLLSYAEAEDWYENTKPIRTIKRKDGDTNSNAGKRPLGHRNRMWFQIDKVGDAIACKIGTRNIVTYHKNGEIEIRNDDYISTSTANFINDLFRGWGGISTYIFDHSLLVAVRSADGDKHQKLGVSKSMKIKKDANYPNGNTWEIVDHKPVVIHKVNKAKRAEIKEKYAGLYKFAKQYLKVLGGTLQTEINPNRRDCLQYFRLDGGWWGWLGGHDEFKQSVGIMRELVSSEGKDQEVAIKDYIEAITELSATGLGVYDWNTKKRNVSEMQLIQGIDKLLLGLHRDEILDTVECVGTPKRDNNGWLYRRGWAKYWEA